MGKACGGNHLLAAGVVNNNVGAYWREGDEDALLDHGAQILLEGALDMVTEETATPALFRWATS